jgi:hypothetical protein
MERTQVLVDRVHGLEAHHGRASRMKRGGMKGGLLGVCVHGRVESAEGERKLG